MSLDNALQLVPSSDVETDSPIEPFDLSDVESDATPQASAETPSDPPLAEIVNDLMDASIVEVTGGDADDEELDLSEDVMRYVSNVKRSRRCRGTEPRAKVFPTRKLKKLIQEARSVGGLFEPERMDAYETDPDLEALRPKTRGDCMDLDVNGERPCPWVSCKHHLYLSVNEENGSLKINFPNIEPWELKHSCALDIAERGGITLEEVGVIMNLTRERIRQLEVRGLLKLKMAHGHDLDPES